MFPRIILTVATVSLMAVAASAAEKTSKDKCTEEVADVRQMQQSGDPRPGAKAEKQISELVEVAEHLCEQGNFQYADSVLRVLRTMMSSE